MLCRRSSALLVFGLTIACGGAEATHTHFHAIQRSEQVIAESMARLERGELETLTAQRRVCESADAICDVASQSEDADADHRCRSALRTCRALR